MAAMANLGRRMSQLPSRSEAKLQRRRLRLPPRSPRKSTSGKLSLAEPLHRAAITHELCSRAATQEEFPAVWRRGWSGRAGSKAAGRRVGMGGRRACLGRGVASARREEPSPARVATPARAPVRRRMFISIVVRVAGGAEPARLGSASSSGYTRPACCAHISSRLRRSSAVETAHRRARCKPRGSPPRGSGGPPAAAEHRRRAAQGRRRRRRRTARAGASSGLDRRRPPQVTSAAAAAMSAWSSTPPTPGRAGLAQIGAEKIARERRLHEDGHRARRLLATSAPAARVAASDDSRPAPSHRPARRRPPAARAGARRRGAFSPDAVREAGASDGPSSTAMEAREAAGCFSDRRCAPCGVGGRRARDAWRREISAQCSGRGCERDDGRTYCARARATSVGGRARRGVRRTVHGGAAMALSVRAARGDARWDPRSLTRQPRKLQLSARSALSDASARWSHSMDLSRHSYLHGHIRAFEFTARASLSVHASPPRRLPPQPWPFAPALLPARCRRRRPSGSRTWRPRELLPRPTPPSRYSGIHAAGEVGGAARRCETRRDLSRSSAARAARRPPRPRP